MNILIVFDTGSVGGHVMSALTTALELKRRGHQVTVISGPGDFVPVLVGDLDYRQIPFVHHYNGRQTYFCLQSWDTIIALKEFIFTRKVEMIHAFDARSYLASFIVAFLWKKIPISCTICGGLSPYNDLPRLAAMIVFSEEQKQKLKEVFHWPDEQIRVIRTRLNIRKFKEEDFDVFTQYKEIGIDPTKKNIMLISTFLDNKVDALKSTLAVMRTICAKYHDVNFVVIGGRGDFYNQAQDIGSSINQEIKRKAVIFTGIIPEASRILRHSFIVFGQGRSAFEGMAFGKPTIVVGETGYAGTVAPEFIDEIAFNNFSGRNKKKFVSYEVMVKELVRLIEDEEYYNSVAVFGRNWVYDNIDIAKGIDKIEAVYGENVNYFENISKFSMLKSILLTIPNLLVDNYYSLLKSIFTK